MRNTTICVLFAILISACVEPPQDERYNYDYLNETSNLYHEYETIDTGSPDADMSEIWDVPSFSFYGTLNNSTTPMDAMELGEGTLLYRAGDMDKAYSEYAWAVKKYIQTSAGHEIPLIQVFFANAIDGENTTMFVLQVAGSSIMKNEANFLDMDKLYKAEITRSGGAVTDICFTEEPPRGEAGGVVYFLEHSSKVGEVLSVKGHAMMQAMDPVDCREM